MICFVRNDWSGLKFFDFFKIETIHCFNATLENCALPVSKLAMKNVRSIQLRHVTSRYDRSYKLQKGYIN